MSGLAHHSGALVVGYALTLCLLALRQVALSNAGVLRGLALSQACWAARRSRRSSGGSAKISDSSAVCTACASG